MCVLSFSSLLSLSLSVSFFLYFVEKKATSPDVFSKIISFLPLWLYDLTSLCISFHIHLTPIVTTVYQLQEDRVALGCEDGTVNIIQATTGQSLAIISNGPSRVRDVAIIPAMQDSHQLILVTSSSDGVLKVRLLLSRADEYVCCSMLSSEIVGERAQLCQCIGALRKK